MAVRQCLTARCSAGAEDKYYNQTGANGNIVGSATLKNLYIRLTVCPVHNKIMQSKETRQNRLDGILKAIRHEPMNRRQLQTHTGYSLGTIDDYIAELRRKKLIYVAKWVRTVGQQSPYWQAGNMPSVEKPAPQTQTEANRKHTAKKMGRKPNVPPPSEFQPRRDISASWF